MKTKRKVLSKIIATHEDIPLMDIVRMVDEARGDKSIEEIIRRNIRVRIERDEVHLGWEEDCTTVFGMKVLSDEPMTDEEIEDERIFLAKRKAEREASDKVQFESLKRRYGW